MTRKPTSHVDAASRLRITIVTLDGHLSGAANRAFDRLQRDNAGISCSLHCAGEWAGDPESLTRCVEDIGQADIVVACMLFMEDHFKAVLPALAARREQCDAMLCFMSASEVMRLTRLGSFSMTGKQTGPMALLQKLRGGKQKKAGSSGARQMALLRRLPRILRFIPGAAQDLRAYFLAMQYWLAGSEDNIRNLVALLIARYANGPRIHFRERIKVAPPVEYPEVGIYHPHMRDRVTDNLAALPEPAVPLVGTVGLLLMRSYVLAGNVRHYDAVIDALGQRGLRVIPAFASGLDARPAVAKFFRDNNSTRIDALVSLTGFSLVGGPAYNDSKAAEEMLAELDIPYIAAHGTEFQSLHAWESSASGLLPVETTMMVALPELDGAIGPTLFAGRAGGNAEAAPERDMQPHPERIAALASRVERLVRLRKTPRSERRIAVVLFNFPPNGGATGTAAYLSVYRSLFNTLRTLQAEGYQVDLPADSDELRQRILTGNAMQYGSDANVYARVAVDDHVRREPWLDDIEKQWGPAPGRQQADGSSIFVLGERFGNVLVGIQPAFGYEGDPMRLLFEQGLAPTHAFAAFYRHLRDDFDADAVLHFGTHGALEFMPGKQTGMSSACWPDRLIGHLPNYYLYAANNPSEGTIAKRRSGATLISYLTPPVTRAGLYRGLADLQSSIDRWRELEPTAAGDREQLGILIQSQAAEVDLCDLAPPWSEDLDARIASLTVDLDELRNELIPHGMHVLGEPPTADERADLLAAVAEMAAGAAPRVDADSDTQPADQSLADRLQEIDRQLGIDSELPAIVRALDGSYIRPVPGGDLIRTPEILPTGRNLHGFDPYRIPTAFAVRAGAAQAEQLLQRWLDDSGTFPESIALVLWGTDSIKTEGGPIAQALRLMGARPRFDGYGRLAGAELIPLAELGRPRIDVVMTLSGIFRDLLPHQTILLAEAAWLAAQADEPLADNFVRKHALAYQADCACDLETAALRVFSNATGAYGSNVNYLVDNGRWNDDNELAEQYSRRKCYAYGRSGAPQRQAELLRRSLKDVDFAFQNLESAELGVTTIDHYFDTLGGISRAVQRAKGQSVEVYIGDQTGSENKIRTLADQVALETRTRVLNPKWYEGMLEHGYEGVRQIESHVTNTMGWSATTGKVAPWVYQQLTQTYVLDEVMRKRLADLNPAASAKVANRLLEAHERKYWSPDKKTLDALERAGLEFEDRLEGISEVAA